MSRPLLGAAALIAGAAVIGWLIHAAGAGAVLEGLRRAAPWLPVAVACETLRIVCELFATCALLGRSRAAVPMFELARAQVIAAALCAVLPAGRTASEAAKATMLAPFVGAARAALMAVQVQLVQLFINALLSVLLLLALSSAAPLLGCALLVNAGACGGLSLAVKLAAEAPQATRWLRRFPRAATLVGELAQALQKAPFAPLAPTLWCIAGRLAQFATLGILLHAAGVNLSVLKLLIAQGLHMVASTAGDLIPAQLGAHDSVFAMANSDFGVPVAALITATTLFHGVQLGVAALGAVVAALSAGMRSAPLPAQSG